MLASNNLDAIVALTNSPAWLTDHINGDTVLVSTSSFSAVAGYPLVNVTAGYVSGLPVGITFMGTAWSEPALIRIASGFEANAGAYRAPCVFRRS